MPLKSESVKTKLIRPNLVFSGLVYERHMYNDLLSPPDRVASLSESQGLYIAASTQLGLNPEVGEDSAGNGEFRRDSRRSK